MISLSHGGGGQILEDCFAHRKQDLSERKKSLTFGAVGAPRRLGRLQSLHSVKCRDKTFFKVLGSLEKPTLSEEKLQRKALEEGAHFDLGDKVFSMET